MAWRKYVLAIALEQEEKTKTHKSQNSKTIDKVGGIQRDKHAVAGAEKISGLFLDFIVLFKG